MIDTWAQEENEALFFAVSSVWEYLLQFRIKFKAEKCSISKKDLGVYYSSLSY